MTQMLASVMSVAEAMHVLELGADIIDLKNPTDGALGALPLEIIRDIVAAIDGRRIVSATIGDPSADASLVARKMLATAATGVDIVKIGIATSRFQLAAWQGIARAPISTRLVAVLFADQHPDFAWIDALATCGFHGVMLDTADKRAGGLRAHLNDERLREFVRRAHSQNLVCGLAGSLRIGDIAPLLAMAPDYFGFRGALCPNGSRTEQLDTDAMRAVRKAIPREDLTAKIT
jgi:(5-formylfuran-3-yl)methyl phosphate synthase